MSIQRDLWISCGVNEYPVLVDVHEGEIGYPTKILWHNARIEIFRRRLTIGCQSPVSGDRLSRWKPPEHLGSKIGISPRRKAAILSPSLSTQVAW